MQKKSGIGMRCINYYLEVSTNAKATICTRSLHSWQARIGANAAKSKSRAMIMGSHKQKFQLLPNLSDTEKFKHKRSFTSIAGGPPLKLVQQA